MTAIETATLVGLALSGVIASFWDIRFRVLPNWLCALTLVAGLAMSFYAGGLTGAGSALAHAAIALVVCMGLWTAGAIGGGDAKFYAAIASWFPLTSGIVLMVSVVLCGLVLLVIVFALRRLLNLPISKEAGDHGKLPYGVAISAGAIAALVLPATLGL